MATEARCAQNDVSEKIIRVQGAMQEEENRNGREVCFKAELGVAARTGL